MRISFRRFKKDCRIDDLKTNQLYHYVYRITNIVENKHYYGSRSISILPKDDLGVLYFSSSNDLEFIQDQKDNPRNYKYKVLRVHDKRIDCLLFESYLHSIFNVKDHKSFYNLSNQSLTGFDYSEGHDGLCVQGTVSIKTLFDDKQYRVTLDEYQKNPFYIQNRGRYIYKIVQPNGKVNLFLSSYMCDKFIFEEVRQGNKSPRDRKWVDDNNGKTINHIQSRYKYLNGHYCETIYYEDLPPNFIQDNLEDIYNPYEVNFWDFKHKHDKARHLVYHNSNRYRIYIVNKNLDIIYFKDFRESIANFSTRININTHMIPEYIYSRSNHPDYYFIKIPNDLINGEVSLFISNYIYNKNNPKV